MSARLLLLLVLGLPSGIARAASVYWHALTPPEGYEGLPVVTPEGVLFGGSVLALLDASGATTVYADSTSLVPGSSATFVAFSPEEYYGGHSVLQARDSQGRRSIHTLSHASGLLTPIVVKGDPVPGSSGEFHGMREPRIGGAGVVFLGGPDPTPFNEQLYYAPAAGGSLQLVTAPFTATDTPYDSWYAVGDERVFFSAGRSPPNGLWSWRPGGSVEQELKNTVVLGDDSLLTHISAAIVDDVIGDTVYFGAADESFAPRVATYSGGELGLLTLDGHPVSEILAMDDAGNMLLGADNQLWAWVDGELSPVPLDDETLGGSIYLISLHRGSMFGNRIALSVIFDDPERDAEIWLASVPEPKVGALALAVLLTLALGRAAQRGAYQIGELQARSWIVFGRLLSPHSAGRSLGGSEIHRCVL